MRSVPPARRAAVAAIPILAILAMLASPAGAQTVGTSATITATDVANVRACAAITCEALARAPFGAKVTITGATSGGWVPVSFQGQAGFIYSFYIDGPKVDAPWLTEGTPGCKRIALIFDIGIGETPSQSVLKTLVDSRTPATMFAMGWWAEAYPGYLRQLRDAGFPIGTHGYSRATLPPRSDADIVSDLQRSVTTIARVIGQPVIRFATPYAAETDPRVRSLIAQQGFLPVGWRVAGNDYAPSASAADVYQRVVGGAYDGAIVELHLDGAATDASTGAALPSIIRDLRAQGYTFVTVPQMATPCAKPAPPAKGRFSTGDSVKTTDALNLRSGPSTGYGVIAVLPNGATGTVVGGPKTAAGFTWWQLRTSFGTGWVAEDWLTKGGDSSRPAPPASTGKFAAGDTTRTTDYLNVRTGPSTGSGVIAVLPPNATGVVASGPRTGSGYTWWQIKTSAGTGWVAENWLAGPISTSPGSPGTRASVRVVNGPLNLRTGSGLSYGVINLLPNGTMLSVLDGPVSASGYAWLKVSSARYGTGWVASEFVR